MFCNAHSGETDCLFRFEVKRGLIVLLAEPRTNNSNVVRNYTAFRPGNTVSKAAAMQVNRWISFTSQCPAKHGDVPHRQDRGCRHVRPAISRRQLRAQALFGGGNKEVRVRLLRHHCCWVVLLHECIWQCAYTAYLRTLKRMLVRCCGFVS